MEEFRRTIEKSFGIKLTDGEVAGLVAHYNPQMDDHGQYLTKDILYDIKSEIEKARKTAKQFDRYDRNIPANTFQEIMSLIRAKLKTKTGNIKGDNEFQKAFVILSDNRCTEVNRMQLKIALNSRLGLGFTDAQIETIFKNLDNDRSGLLKIR